jgi:hypothetical protein
VPKTSRTWGKKCRKSEEQSVACQILRTKTGPKCWTAGNKTVRKGRDHKTFTPGGNKPRKQNRKKNAKKLNKKIVKNFRKKNLK